jgi:nucleotide-binding universal stress UspA family protein
MRIQRILVATDFSDTAITAARWAAERFAPHAEVVLLHVIEPPDRPRLARDPLPDEATFEGVAREHAETRLRELTATLARHDVRGEIRVGRPYEQVATVATEVQADVVVIGPHGDRPRPSKFLGTTADRIARTCPVPVLVVTNPGPGTPKHILAPVDDAAITPELTEWARMLAEQFDAHVTLLHVWSNAVYSHVASAVYAQKHTDAEAQAEIQKELSEAADRWLRDLVPNADARTRFTATVSYGYSGDETLAHARRESADLIVIGRTGAGLVKPALLGNTTETVLHGAPCPVLIVTRGGAESASSPH